MYIHVIKKRNQHSKSYCKEVIDSSIFAKLLIAARDVYKHDFWTNFGRKIRTILDIDFTFFKLKAQLLKQFYEYKKI